MMKFKMINKYPLTVAEKHKILYGGATGVSVLIELGNKYLSDGNPVTALEFFEYASHSEGIKKIKKIAIDEGDLFLYKLAVRAEGINSQDEDLIKIKENAEKNGKTSYAENAGKEKVMADKILAITNPPSPVCVPSAVPAAQAGNAQADPPLIKEDKWK